MPGERKVFHRCRLLVDFSYLGQRFCSPQYQYKSVTVEGSLRSVLTTLLQGKTNSVKTLLGTFTDPGVNAVRNNMLIDVPGRKDGLFGVRGDPQLPGGYDLTLITHCCNRLLLDLNLDIRILNIRPVALGFCPRRHAQGRTFTVRLAALKPEHSLTESRPDVYRPDNNPHEEASMALPVTEVGRIIPVSYAFDPDKLRTALSTFIVRNHRLDYSAIIGDQRADSNYQAYCQHQQPDQPGSFSVDNPRIIDQAELIDVTEDFVPNISESYDRFKFYHLSFTGKDFLPQQVRRLSAVLIDHACGHVTRESFQMLFGRQNNGESHEWLKSVSAGGVFLQNVSYRESDYQNPCPEYQSMPIMPDCEVYDQFDVNDVDLFSDSMKTVQ